jgi:hypothetical protein
LFETSSFVLFSWTDTVPWYFDTKTLASAFFWGKEALRRGNSPAARVMGGPQDPVETGGRMGTKARAT